MSNEIIGEVSAPLQIIGEITPNAEINVSIIGSGAAGKDGTDGVTPIKGVDYFTSEEIQEIIIAVSNDANYIHDQIASAKTWSITHNLNKFPAITVVDTAGSIVFGETSYINTNQIQITFSAEFSGKAYLN